MWKVVAFISFNSILVWLKEFLLEEWFLDNTVFQFHSGLIKSPFVKYFVMLGIVFQFHSGLIKRYTGRSWFCDGWRFQFHSGLIKSPIACGSWECPFWFQFHSGLIKRARLLENYQSWLTSFNSILVWLKVIQFYCSYFLSFGFNSILVWLKGPPVVVFLNCPPVFQFHSGLIKSSSGVKNMGWVTLFQFHSGLIKSSR